MAKNSNQAELFSSEEKIARLLALVLIKDVEQKSEQISLLRSAGFQTSEVAMMLGVSNNYVDVAVYKSRKKKKKKQKN